MIQFRQLAFQGLVTSLALTIILSMIWLSLYLTASGLSTEISSILNNSHSSYTFVIKWGSYGTADSQFRRPHDVAFDSEGYVYVTDRDNNNVQKFTHNGTLGVLLAVVMANLESHIV